MDSTLPLGPWEDPTRAPEDTAAANAQDGSTSEASELSAEEGLAPEAQLPDAQAPVRIKGGLTPAADQPVASIILESSVPHLARPFDYAVPQQLAGTAQVGVRVRVKFAGRLTTGFLLARSDTTEHLGELAPIERIATDLVVLTPEILQLCQEIARRYAGTLPDVLRLAVPPRHARGEKSARALPDPGIPAPVPLTYPRPELDSFATYLTALKEWVDKTGPQTASSEAPGPRAALAVLPGSQPGTGWIGYGIAAAQTALLAGKGVLWLVPDQKELTELRHHLGGWEAHLAVLSADQGTEVRWKAFTRILTGQAKLVIGTRAAAFAPVRDLGLVLCFDDYDDSFAGLHAPYPHAREVLLTRAAHGAACLFMATGRSAEIQRLVSTGWLGEMTVPAPTRRDASPLVLIPEPDSDPDAVHRIPNRAFRLMRTALGLVPKHAEHPGPVLVQVPRAGYVPVFACANCGTIARCPECDNTLHAAGPAGPCACRACGYTTPDFQCRNCHATTTRSVVRGLQRTHEELGRAFPGIPVIRSGGEQTVARIAAKPAIVVATTGAEPYVDGGYAAAVLLDTLWPGPGLHSTDRAVQRRLQAASLVRARTRGGTVYLLDEDPLVQTTLVRWDPVGYAHSQVVERSKLTLPPSVRTLSLSGANQDIDEVLNDLSQHDLPVTELLRTHHQDAPPHHDNRRHQHTASQPNTTTVICRFPISAGTAVTGELQAITASRSAARAGIVTVRIDDPAAL